MPYSFEKNGGNASTMDGQSDTFLRMWRRKPVPGMGAGFSPQMAVRIKESVQGEDKNTPKSKKAIPKNRLKY